jgi:hypothetical protein
MSRKAGASMILTSIVFAVAGPFILGFFSNAIESGEIGGVEAPPQLIWFIAHRFWYGLLALPAFLCGVNLLRNPRGRWLFVTLGYLLMFLPLALILYLMYLIISPLYQMQEL